jgi:biotin operon repressor
MNPGSDEQRRKPLVTVEFQREVDLATGRGETRRFVKMYFDARDSGLLASLPDELWKTLCLLATYLDENGYCYPSQEKLAKDLNIGRQALNQRIQRLKEFRFDGNPVLSIERVRIHSEKGPTRWSNNVYYVHAIAGLNYGRQGDAKVKTTEESGKISMSPQHDIENSGSMSFERDTESPASMSRPADTARGDTNKNERIETNVNNVGQKSLEKKRVLKGRPRLTRDQFGNAQGLAATIAETIGQEENLRSYFRIAADCVLLGDVQLLFDALGETKERMQDGAIRTTPSQYFHHAVKRRMGERHRARPSPKSETPINVEEDRSEARAAREEFLARSRFPGTGTERK